MPSGMANHRGFPRYDQFLMRLLIEDWEFESKSLGRCLMSGRGSLAYIIREGHIYEILVVMVAVILLVGVGVRVSMEIEIGRGGWSSRVAVAVDLLEIMDVFWAALDIVISPAFEAE